MHACRQCVLPDSRNFYGPPAKAFGGASAEGGASLPQPSPDTPEVGRVHGGHFAAVVRSEL